MIRSSTEDKYKICKKKFKYPVKNAYISKAYKTSDNSLCQCI